MKKKINLLIVFMLMMFIGLGSVNAASLTLTPTSKNLKVGEEVTIVAGLVDYTGEEFTANLDYSECSTYLTKLSAQPLNKMDINMKENKNYVTLKFKSKQEGTCKIKLTSSKLNIIDGVSTITIINKTDTTSKKNTTTTEKVTTTVPTTTAVPKSNNADLEFIEITDYNNNKMTYTPEFNSGVYEYTLEVSSDIKKLNYTVKAVDEKANIVISDNAYHELVSGDNNRIVITVTAEDGTQKAYYINVKRNVMETDATLKSLTISNVPEFKFKPDKFTYNLKLDKKIKKLNIDYETISENAIVTITGNDKLKDGSKVKILVTAEDGSKREYILNISYEEDKKEIVNKPITETIVERNPVIIMLLSMVAFGLIGGIVYISKK